MATNPMQRKSRMSFMLGMGVMLLIAAIIVAVLFMKIKNQQKEISTYVHTTSYVYVLNQDVRSGQVLTEDMFTYTSVPTVTIPADSDINAQMGLISLCTTGGASIITGIDEEGQYYYYIDSAEKKLYTMNSATGSLQQATALMAGEKAYYYENGTSGTTKEVTVSNNTIIAKVDLSERTIVTSGMIGRGNEKSTNDLRKTEYNIINLPIDLITGDYIDVRLMLPGGQNYIVVSKKNVTVPMANGTYLADTIQMNLSEDEILTLSGAIVESFKIDGAYLYATRYTEPGLQEAAKVTYYPSNEVISVIQNNPNIVNIAISEISAKKEEIRKNINNALSQFGDDEKLPSALDESGAASLEARQQYLQSVME